MGYRSSGLLVVYDGDLVRLDLCPSITILTVPFSFTTSVNGATALITMTGFSWAVIMWVPFALVCLFYTCPFEVLIIVIAR